MQETTSTSEGAEDVTARRFGLLVLMAVIQLAALGIIVGVVMTATRDEAQPSATMAAGQPTDGEVFAKCTLRITLDIKGVYRRDDGTPVYVMKNGQQLLLPRNDKDQFERIEVLPEEGL